MASNSTLSALALTHVLYDASSHKSELAALVTLSPILLMPAYAGIIVKTRELTVINMVAGQLASDLFNSVLKHIVKQERPNSMLGDGYGFPSSHSQYMGYFSTFLLLHLTFRHKFVSYGPELKLINTLQRTLLYFTIMSWAAGVCFSRYYLAYHTPPQVLAGYSIGLVLAIVHYFATEPTSPTSSCYWRTRLLDSSLAQYLRIRDGWAVYTDGGAEEEYFAWRRKWDIARVAKAAQLQHAKRR